ncbi:MAG: hypothetical protein IKH75_01035 [Ruminococcus sp.]|nr:hypothetical protein [Ruminococcus sp.]
MNKEELRQKFGRVAEMTDTDKWDMAHCNKCGNVVDSENRYCSQCGSYLLNHKPQIRYHYFCKKCGEEMTMTKYTVRPGNTETGEQQTMTACCEHCGHKNTFTFDDAEKEVIPEPTQFDFIDLNLPENILTELKGCIVQRMSKEGCNNCIGCELIDMLVPYGFYQDNDDPIAALTDYVITRLFAQAGI